ncbi:helix-turn-helix transcriptional regulator [Parvularcula sp. LCG005]|uniref:helix-turn-helix transcriptional regulator n=1 Tax=Parvularcula sp. LCG005 TaxID=3078805 RepID=UPI00294261CA|nr:helix-turn-helix transcriptional regulator [Parvularcula sp. LCG005]WOI53857.1 helix-turn-helix transcriptional regulator [Parvularcula sp. LCG005]
MFLEKFIVDAHDCHAVCALREHFLSFLENYGVTDVIGHVMPFGGTFKGGWEPIISTFPKEVTDFYRGITDVERDPFLNRLLMTGGPVLHSEVKNAFNWSEQTARMSEMMRDNGMRDSLGVMTLAGPGLAAVFALVFPREVDLDETKRMTLQMGCYVFFKRQQQLKNDGTSASLTPRERQIMVGILRGQTNPLIADQLGISEHTVDTYVRRLFAKVEASSRLELAMKCLCAGQLVNFLLKKNDELLGPDPVDEPSAGVI